jgi:hypothetical protein
MTMAGCICKRSVTTPALHVAFEEIALRAEHASTRVEELGHGALVRRRHLMVAAVVDRADRPPGKRRSGPSKQPSSERPEPLHRCQTANYAGSAPITRASGTCDGLARNKRLLDLTPATLGVSLWPAWGPRRIALASRRLACLSRGGVWIAAMP